MKTSPKYKLRFFFDYNCGGCLWSDNEVTSAAFGVGCLDSDIYDLNGNVSQKAQINLPDELKSKVFYLDELYSQSLNWNDPIAESPWSKEQWDSFHNQARELHQQIKEELGSEFEVIYRQE